MAVIFMFRNVHIWWKIYTNDQSQHGHNDSTACCTMCEPMKAMTVGVIDFDLNMVVLYELETESVNKQ